MGLFMVATIKKNNKIIGVRLVDSNTGEIKDVSLSNIINVLSSGKAEVGNLTIHKGDLKGVGGSLDRYGIVGISQSCTILEQYKNGETVIGYKVADANGVIKKLDVEKALGVAEILGIANGKVVERDGKKYISAIEGNYAIADVVNKNESTQIKVSNESLNLKLVDGIIINATTSKPICEQGELRFSKIYYYNTKCVIAETVKDQMYYRDTIRIYKYTYDKDTFEQVLQGLSGDVTVTRLTNGVLFSSMRTGSYGEFRSSHVAMFNRAADKISTPILTSHIFSEKFTEANASGSKAIVYDLSRAKIGAFSPPNPELNIYEIDFQEFSFNKIASILISGDIRKVDWIKHNGNQLESLDFCIKVGNVLGVIKEHNTYELNISGKETDIDTYTDYLGSVELKDGVKVLLSNGTNTKSIKMQQTRDRGKIITIS